MKSVHSRSSGKWQTATDVDKNVHVIITAVTQRGNSLKSDCYKPTFTLKQYTETITALNMPL